jgi:hypothetical protein
VSDREAVTDFEIAAPALVELRALQRRIDRKFLLGDLALPPLLARLRSAYVLLLAGSQRWARYESVYFDTPERDLFHAHRRGRQPRCKIRIRHHVDRQLSFLEIKRKERSGRTTKTRIDLPFGATVLSERERRLIEEHGFIAAQRLVPCASVSFLRLTVLGRDADERLTFDRHLRMSDGIRVEELPRIVVAEVKQAHHATTGAVAALRAHQAREAAISKYCLATVLLAPVRANLFKPALRAIARLSG